MIYKSVFFKKEMEVFYNLRNLCKISYNYELSHIYQ